MPTTPGGYPYPAASDKIGQVPAQVKALAEAIPVIDRGDNAIPITTMGTAVAVAVTFNKTFSAPPTVVAVPFNSANATELEVKVNAVTATGFSLVGINRGSTGAFRGSWIAVGI